MSQPTRVADYERQFRRAGLPSFVETQRSRPAVVVAAGDSVWIVRWGVSHGWLMIRRSLVLLMRTLPLVIGVSVVLFMTDDWWRTMIAMDRLHLTLLVLFVVALAAILVIGSVGRAVADIESRAGSQPPLTERQRRNVALIVLISQTIQLLVLTAAIWLFFLVFGLLAIPTDVQAEWSNRDVTAMSGLFGTDPDLGLTTTLTVVAGGIAVFSGLSLAISSVSDKAFRRQVRRDVAGPVATTSTARHDYLALLAATETTGSDAGARLDGA
ncbi:MAG: hypothetical protein U0R64_03655 [Candidatus Nanopelagicales bacterium]